MSDHEFFQSVSPPVKERAIATLINIDKLFREMSLEMEKWTRPWREIRSVWERAGVNANSPSAKGVIWKRKAWKQVLFTPIPDSSFQSSVFVDSSFSSWRELRMLASELTLSLSFQFFFILFFFYWYGYTHLLWHAWHVHPMFWSPVTGVCRVTPVCGSFHGCVFSQEQPIVPAGSDERAINSTNLLRLCQQHFIKTLCVGSCWTFPLCSQLPVVADWGSWSAF